MELNFKSQSKLHQRVYLRSRTLLLAESGLDASGWVWSTLKTIAATSQHERLQDSQLQVVLNSLREIARDVEWCECANVLPRNLTLECGIKTLEALDNAVDQLHVTGDQKARKASRIRLWLQRGAVILGVPRAERIAVQYRSRFVTGRGQPRKMLSDEKSSPTLEAEFPLGALPHTTVADLIEKERYKREVDLLRVVAAAEAEVEEHFSRHSFLRHLLEFQPTDCTARLEREINYVREALPDWLKSAKPTEVAAAYFQLFNDAEFWARRRGSRVKTPGANIVFDFIEEQLKQPIPRYRLVETLVLPFASQQVLTACLLLIQAHTGWNVNSVLEMTRSMVTGESPRYVLQGYKGRIDELTPIVETSVVDVGVLRALELLLNRHKWLVANGWIAASEKRLWLNPVSIQNDPDPKPYVGWGTSLKRFRDKHRLQHFSFEQVRVQKLSLISLSSAGARGAQEVAGHLQLSTTGHYLEQEVLIRLRSAMNLEYQRRLESAIQFDFAEPTKTSKHAYLLRDIGDGASCRAPSNPPRLEELVDGQCRAIECHTGESGCPNREIRIDDKSLEAALRMNKFYSSNWSRMATDNLKAFEKLHLPRLIFNKALLHVVARGPYRSKLRAIEGRINEDMQ